MYYSRVYFFLSHTSRNPCDLFSRIFLFLPSTILMITSHYSLITATSSNIPPTILMYLTPPYSCLCPLKISTQSSIRNQSPATPAQKLRASIFSYLSPSSKKSKIVKKDPDTGWEGVRQWGVLTTANTVCPASFLRKKIKEMTFILLPEEFRGNATLLFGSSTRHSSWSYIYIFEENTH